MPLVALKTIQSDSNHDDNMNVLSSDVFYKIIIIMYMYVLP